MEIKDSVAFVTGANRGIGAEFVRQLLDRGAAKVYAASRSGQAVDDHRVVPIVLDVTDGETMAQLAASLGDVSLLINNAGIASGEPLINGSLHAIRAEFETNTFGPLMLTRAFAPVLGRNHGGAVLNVLSAAVWFAAPGATAYAASKAAAWSITDGLRIELAQQGTQVLALHMAMVDTDMTAGIDVPKSSPEEIVTRALDGLERGGSEVLADDATQQLKAELHRAPADRYAAMLTPRADQSVDA